ncbi:MAG: helix-turn-helix domain-containing protein [Pseudomonadota bacterium]
MQEQNLLIANPVVPSLKVDCSHCHLRELCIPHGVKTSQTRDLFDDFQFSRLRIKAGQPAFHEGQALRSLYAVRSGTFKTSSTLTDGREQVSGFQIAGELMGLDGIASGAYIGDAMALEDGEVCVIPYPQVTSLSGNYVQQGVGRLMSEEIVRQHKLLLLLGSLNSEERLLAFLVDLSTRLKLRGYSPLEFHLRMSRAEIGSYLGLTLETVSRAFSRFQKQGLMNVDNRHIRILDTKIFQQVLH